MPRIAAPTVAEHHANQRRAVLDAARDLLGETAQLPSMAAIGKRAGLARTSVYQYFGSAEELLAAVVADVFPDWAARVLDRVEAADSPAARVWAYVEANVDLFTSSEQQVARALTMLVAPDVLRRPMEAFHARIRGPLRDALADFGDPDPDTVATLVDTLIVTAARHAVDSDTATADADGSATRRVALDGLRRLIGPYLERGPANAG